MKNKFQVIATNTDLQSSETYKLANFWEKDAKEKPKSEIQTKVLKIGLSNQPFGADPQNENRATVTGKTVSQGVKYESQETLFKSQVASSYENAPNDSINTSVVTNPRGAQTSDEQQLNTINNDIAKLQSELDKLHQNSQA